MKLKSLGDVDIWGSEGIGLSMLTSALDGTDSFMGVKTDIRTPDTFYSDL
jgi:hypothetical protein